MPVWDKLIEVLPPRLAAACVGSKSIRKQLMADIKYKIPIVE